MFPAYLRDAGYYTTNKSKTDYNATPGKGVWDASSKKADWRNRKDGQPFFHKVTFAQSHEGSLHFSQQQMENQKTRTDPATVALPPYHPDTPTFRYTHARYRDNIRTIDGLVGKVLADKYADLYTAGWRPTEEEVARDTRHLLGGSFEEFLKK